MTTRPPTTLRLTDVSFRYAGGPAVLRAFNLATTPGEFLVILGSSGCGKSTLLNLMAGFVAPDVGSVRLNGHAVRPETPELGYVFQSPQLFPWLSALDNVRFGLKMANRLSPAEQEAKAREHLRLVGLEGAADKLPHQLSGGMKQRVSLARALAPEPGLLLADEPFAALDAISRRRMNEELLRLWAELGQTVVFVTHDIDEAVFLADRIVLLGPAPQGIDSEWRVDLDRPRQLVRTSRLPRFAELRNELLERIAHVTESPA